MSDFARTPHHLQLNIRMSEEMDRIIEEYRRGQERIPTRTEAVKLFIWEGMRAKLGYIREAELTAQERAEQDAAIDEFIESELELERQETAA